MEGGLPETGMTGEDVRKAREALGLTQDGLAAVLRIEGEYRRDTVRGWESGKRDVPGPAAVAIGFLLEQKKCERSKRR